MSSVNIIGRSSSHFTRVPLIFAHELEVPFDFTPIYDLTQLGAEIYSGNPALKLPILRVNESVLFGSQNMCRALADRARISRRIAWPEALHDDLSRNAQELVMHCMNAQVQLVFGLMVAKLPADSIYFKKARAGFEGALGWLDSNLRSALGKLPPHDLSLFEVLLFCLIEHMRFRETLPLEPYPALVSFTDEFAQRRSAQQTPYRLDVPPAK
jgi:glutathione S-transferase